MIAVEFRGPIEMQIEIHPQDGVTIYVARQGLELEVRLQGLGENGRAPAYALHGEAAGGLSNETLPADEKTGPCQQVLVEGPVHTSRVEHVVCGCGPYHSIIPPEPCGLHAAPVPTCRCAPRAIDYMVYRATYGTTTTGWLG